MRILAIESSCDETAAAVIENGTTILSSVISTSSTLHSQFGGILPELAARKQLDYILPVITQALKNAFPESFGVAQQINNSAIQQCITTQIDAIAVTQGPGLIGSLLIGVEAAKTLAFVSNKPIIPVNHVHAHIFANFIRSDLEKGPTFTYPAIALVVSGGHTELFLMENERNLKWLSGTVDDAAGEAFDKTARLLGFENRGGQAIEEAALKFSVSNFPSKEGKRFPIHLPRPLLHDGTLNFSFSGLKTAVLREWNKQLENLQLTTYNLQLTAAFAYEIQEAITDVLVAKTCKAAEQFSVQTILLSGGVAANQRLRDKFPSQYTLYAPPKNLCTDNGAAIGSAAYFIGKPIDWHQITATPNLSVEI